MIGNGNGGIVHPKMMRADPNILRAVQHIQDLANDLIAISVVGMTRNGNRVNLSAIPPDVDIMSLTVRQLFNLMRKVDDEIDRMNHAAQEVAPPVGKILRPPPILGG